MLRFVPIANSLDDNAPGYSSIEIHEDGTESVVNTTSLGPICWKCAGNGHVRIKQSLTVCKVCKGAKRLSKKRKATLASNSVGEVTKRSTPAGWVAHGPFSVHSKIPVEELPTHLRPTNGEQLCYLVGNWRIFQRVGGHRWTTDDLVTSWEAGNSFRNKDNSLSTNRITSDNSSDCRSSVHRILDLGSGNGSVLLMNAWQFPNAACCVGIEARSEAVALARRSIEFNCGKQDEKSLSNRVTIYNADFRTLLTGVPKLFPTSTEDLVGSKQGSTRKERTAPGGGDTFLISSPLKGRRADTNETEGTDLSGLFDLITGTPPYFRVDFVMAESDQLQQRQQQQQQQQQQEERLPRTAASTTAAGSTTVSANEISTISGGSTCTSSHNEKSSSASLSATVTAAKTHDDATPATGAAPAAALAAVPDLMVEKAIIREGGMPTCKESAPARCEFRGGIEAYCAAAAEKLTDEGFFVVCLNWQNHSRVLKAAQQSHLRICRMLRVMGKEGKPPLFCVYTMQKSYPVAPTPLSAAAVAAAGGSGGGGEGGSGGGGGGGGGGGSGLTIDDEEEVAQVPPVVKSSSLLSSSSSSSSSIAIATAAAKIATLPAVTDPPAIARARPTSTTSSAAVDDDDDDDDIEDKSVADAYRSITRDLVVRDSSGAWTAEYRRVLHDMSYPIC